MSDLISRDAAINEIQRWVGYLDQDMILRIQISIEKLPSAQQLSEVDLIELEDRFGPNVRFIVEDMIKGEGKRWQT